MAKRFNSVNSYMTSLIDKATEIDKKDPLWQYIRERIEMSNFFIDKIPERALVEIKLILINIEKRLEL